MRPRVQEWADLPRLQDRDDALRPLAALRAHCSTIL